MYTVVPFPRARELSVAVLSWRYAAITAVCPPCVFPCFEMKLVAASSINSLSHLAESNTSDEYIRLLSSSLLEVSTATICCARERQQNLSPQCSTKQLLYETVICLAREDGGSIQIVLWDRLFLSSLSAKGAQLLHTVCTILSDMFSCCAHGLEPYNAYSTLTYTVP